MKVLDRLDCHQFTVIHFLIPNFSYGGTEEFGAMITWLRENHPSNHLLGVGLSMGANVMTKFLGESVKNQKNFIGALSICQGYDMEKVIVLYFLCLTLIAIHQHVVLTEVPMLITLIQTRF